MDTTRNLVQLTLSVFNPVIQVFFIVLANLVNDFLAVLREI